MTTLKRSYEGRAKSSVTNRLPQFDPRYILKCFTALEWCLFVCVEVLRPSQPNGVMSSVVSLPNHTFTGQA